MTFIIPTRHVSQAAMRIRSRPSLFINHKNFTEKNGRFKLFHSSTTATRSRITSTFLGDSSPLDTTEKNKNTTPSLSPSLYQVKTPILNQYTNITNINLNRQYQQQHQQQQQQSIRHISSVTELVPEFAKQYTIWGGSGIILKAFHSQHIPYWGCMSLTNIVVRSSLFPLVIKGAKTSAKFANVAPEIQFLTSSYINDAKKLKDANAPPSQRLELLIATWKTLLGIWKLNGVNPFDVMKSPLMQIPVFWYFSVDIRKLINGGDPELAQQLTESGFFWVMDLTEPDPWYGLPILSGMFLYLNVEMAVGKQNLSGETASKSNLASYLKDGFQSLAVVMPCFMSQSPAGVQIYLLTSFIFTLGQGVALRNDTFRGYVGLPLKGAPPPEGKFVKEFIQLNKLERESFGVLAPSAYSSFKPYAQIFSQDELEEMEKESKNTRLRLKNTHSCVLSPEAQPLFEPSSTYLIVQQLQGFDKDKVTKKKPKKGEKKKPSSLDKIAGYEPSADEVMEYANKGLKPPAPIKFAPVEEEVQTESTTLLKTKSLKVKRKKKGRRKK